MIPFERPIQFHRPLLEMATMALGPYTICTKLPIYFIHPWLVQDHPITSTRSMPRQTGEALARHVLAAHGPPSGHHVAKGRDRRDRKLRDGGAENGMVVVGMALDELNSPYLTVSFNELIMIYDDSELSPNIFWKWLSWCILPRMMVGITIPKFRSK